MPLVANVPQALPIEVLQVPEPQAALDRQREGEDKARCGPAQPGRHLRPRLIAAM